MRESTQIPDLTWNVSFFSCGFEIFEAFLLESLMLESSTGFWEGPADVESELKVNEPKGSELSQLFSGTTANGSQYIVNKL